MRNVIFKFQFIVGLLLFACLNVQADDDLVTKQITIKLDKAGTLSGKIASTRKYKLTNLKIIGDINGTDLRFIREMAGKDVQGNKTEGNLATLDLLEAKIVSGGDYYFYPSYYTSNDAIGKFAFYGCSGLTSITLPYSVTSIGKFAFEGCSGLTSITIPSSVTSIDGWAFYGCDLKECNCILTTDMETYIGMDHRFWSNIPFDMKYYLNGQELTRLDIPTDVKKIGDYAFYRCSGLSNITIPSSVTSIGDYAFYRCSGLSNITIPSSVTSIGVYAFRGCSRLSNITLPSSITSISAYAFYGCSGLTNIVIPSSVISIGRSAFADCSSLSNITIPSSVTSIGESAFEGCSGLSNITLPSSVTSIGVSAFADCSGLSNITLPSSITSIGVSAFADCSSLSNITIPSNVTTIDGYTFKGCSGLSNLIIPSNVDSIGWSAFEGCSGLTSITIPSSVTKIGSSAFEDCSSLRSVYVSWETPISIDTSYNLFMGIDKKVCTLYVPQGTCDDYYLCNWGDYFNNIVEYDATGINHVTTFGNVKEISRYGVNGQRLDVPIKGLNIVKYSDGSVKKVVVQ